MGVVCSCNQLHHRQLIGVLVFGERNLGDEFAQHLRPVLPCDLAIGRPVLHDVPQAVQGEDLIAGVGKLDGRVRQLMIEGRIACVFHQRNVELLTLNSVLIDVFQALAQRLSKYLLVVDPVEVRFDVEVVESHVRARFAVGHLAEPIDPLHQRGVGLCAIGRRQHPGHHAKQLVVPMALA